MYFNLPSSRAPGKNFCCYYLNYNSITLKPSTLSVLFWQNESILKKKKKAIPKYRAFSESNMHHILNKLPKRFLPPTNRHRSISASGSFSVFVQVAPWEVRSEPTGKQDDVQGLYCGCLFDVFCSAHKQKSTCWLSAEMLTFPVISEFNVLGLWHFGKCFLNTQGCQPWCRIVSPAFCHEFPHLP